MKKFTILIFILFISLSNAQDLTSWLGHYTGDLKSESINANTNVYHMELKIEAKTDSIFNWVIIYGNEGDKLRSERNYLLKRTAIKNNFIIDEQNSILLDINLINNSFYSVFEVEGNLIMIEYRLSKNQIDFILSSGHERKETGNTIHDGEEIPLVYSYKTTTAQHAVLKKI